MIFISSEIWFPSNICALFGNMTSSLSCGGRRRRLNFFSSFTSRFVKFFTWNLPGDFSLFPSQLVFVSSFCFPWNSMTMLCDSIMSWEIKISLEAYLPWLCAASCRRPGLLRFALLRNAEAYTFVLSFYSLWIHLEWAFYGSQHSSVCWNHKKWIRKNAPERGKEERKLLVFDIPFTCWSNDGWKIIQGNGFVFGVDHLLSFCEEWTPAECCDAKCERNINYGCEVERRQIAC